MCEELPNSELGTQKYWESTYKKEVENFRNHGDVGEVWFGEHISKRIVKWIEKNVSKSSSILDVGCGNGVLLSELSELGYQHLVGVDYSEDAITLAKEIACQQNQKIGFVVGDILQDTFKSGEYDVVLDKGTYDAVSLMDDSAINRKQYVQNICNNLKAQGLLIITSCNWTSQELKDYFSTCFRKVDVIPTPQFQFGGQIGNVVSSIIFQKNV